MIKLILKTLLYSIIFAAPLLASEMKERREFHSVIMPGQNGAGGQSFERFNIVNTPKAQTSHYQTLSGSNIDFGQGNCLKDFERQLKADSPAQKGKKILYGVSQGTATLTNWLAQMPHKEQEEQVGALVVESVLGSGNNAIMHTIESSYKPVTYLPFARAWIPLVAKVIYPTYNPLGKSALASAQKISPRMPVVIMHNKDDFQLDVNDARQMYCTLRENGNNNAYLMEVNAPGNKAHIDILYADSHDQRAKKIAGLQAIYKKHGLPFKAAALNKEVKPEDFQPPVEAVKKEIAQSTLKQSYLRNAIDLVSAACIIGYFAFWKK